MQKGRYFSTVETDQNLNHCNFEAMQHSYIQSKLLPQSPSVLLLRFHGVEEWKFNDVRPDCRAGASAQTATGNDKREAKMGSVVKLLLEMLCSSKGILPDELQL